MARSEQPSEARSETRHAPVYVNDRKVPIDTPNPSVGEVVQKAGLDPQRHAAFLLRNAKDTSGVAIRMEKVLHLEGRNEPLYLLCVPKGVRDQTPAGVVPTLTSQPEEDPRRAINLTDLRTPTPPGPEPAPEPPGPPGL